LSQFVPAAILKSRYISSYSRADQPISKYIDIDIEAIRELIGSRIDAKQASHNLMLTPYGILGSGAGK
jgi:hypothetical protein